MIFGLQNYNFFYLWGLSKKIFSSGCIYFNFFVFLQPQKGLVAEGLGAGLQNRLQRFESARDLRYNLL